MNYNRMKQVVEFLCRTSWPLEGNCYRTCSCSRWSCPMSVGYFHPWEVSFVKFFIYMAENVYISWGQTNKRWPAPYIIVLFTKSKVRHDLTYYQNLLLISKNQLPIKTHLTVLILLFKPFHCRQLCITLCWRLSKVDIWNNQPLVSVSVSHSL